ncbi:hypothetical protein [Pleurocapsa sp. PCC 7327]|nr:hypothetical protein [Pleurocapsa sp. PCC 7327]
MKGYEQARACNYELPQSGLTTELESWLDKAIASQVGMSQYHLARLLF